MRKRSFFLLLLPIILVIWIIGWAFFWTGSQSAGQEPEPLQDDGLEIAAALPRQEEELAQ